MGLVLGFILGIVIAIFLTVCLNGSKFLRTVGLVLAVVCVVIMFNHDGSFIKATNNYDLESIPFTLGLIEGAIELIFISFPIVRAFTGFFNLVKSATPKQQQGLSLLAKIVRLFMR